MADAAWQHVAAAGDGDRPPHVRPDVTRAVRGRVLPRGAFGDLETPSRYATLAIATVWLSVVGFGGYRAYATLLRPVALDSHLTTVSHRELLGGLLYAEGLLWGVPAAVFVGLGTLSFAAGVGAPLLVVTIPLAATFALATGLGTGVLLALVVRNLGVRSQLLARLRTLFFALLALAYFGVIVTQSVESILGPVLLVLEPSPVGWFGDLALLGTAPDASPLLAAGAVVASDCALVLLAVANARLAELLWYADGVHVEHDVDGQAEGDGDDSTVTALLGRVCSQPTLGVVLADWKRARRAPVAKSFVGYPLLVLLGPVGTAFQTGTIPGSLPLWLALLGPWIVGAAFALNPLGNEGAVLPATLLADSPGRSLVVGHVTAGVLVGVPVVVSTVLVIGVLSPLSLAATASLAVATLVLTVAAGPIATGTGALLPRFEAVSVTQSTRAVVPSVLAFAVYSVVLGIVATPALLGHSALFGHAIANLAGVSPTVLGVAGTALTAVLALLLAVASAYYAVDAVERYVMDW